MEGLTLAAAAVAATVVARVERRTAGGAAFAAEVPPAGESGDGFGDKEFAGDCD